MIYSITYYPYNIALYHFQVYHIILLYAILSLAKMQQVKLNLHTWVPVLWVSYAIMLSNIAVASIRV